MERYDDGEIAQSGGEAGRRWPTWLKVVIGLVAAGGGIALLGFWFVMSMMKGDAYELAMARASADPKVKAALGTPIESAFFISGSVQTNSNGGVADLQIPVEGPNGTGTVFVHAIQGGGYWGISKMQVRIDKDQSVIQIPIGRAR